MHPTPGCLPCKARKKKCDNVNPICSGCTRNYLVCVWPTEAHGRPRGTRGVPSSAMTMFSVNPQAPSQKPGEGKDKTKLTRRRRELHPAESVPVALGPLSMTGPLRPQSRYLLHHYMHSTGKKASAHVGSYTPFTDTLMPVADTSAMLLESILAFSCFHLAAHRSAISPITSLEQQGLALKSVKHGIIRYSLGDKDFGIPLFLSMLMLTCIENANGGQTGSALQHLGALRKIAPDVLARIDDAPSGSKSAISFGRELYAYCLTTACICDPAAPDDLALIDEAAKVFSDMSASGFTGALFGCADALFCLIPQIVILLNQSRRLGVVESGHNTGREGNVSPLDDDDKRPSLRSQIAILLTRVSLWEPDNRVPDITFQHSGRTLQLALMAMLVEAAHWANSAIPRSGARFDYTTPGTPCLNTQLGALVHEGVALLEKLPPSKAQIATTMCWSVVVLGSYATLSEDRSAFREYLLTMETSFGFNNMRRSRLALEYIWAHVTNFEQDRPMSIADAMRGTGGMFLLG